MPAISREQRSLPGTLGYISILSSTTSNPKRIGERPTPPPPNYRHYLEARELHLKELPALLWKLSKHKVITALALCEWYIDIEDTSEKLFRRNNSDRWLSYACYTQYHKKNTQTSMRSLLEARPAISRCSIPPFLWGHRRRHPWIRLMTQETHSGGRQKGTAFEHRHKNVRSATTKKQVVHKTQSDMYFRTWIAHAILYTTREIDNG